MLPPLTHSQCRLIRNVFSKTVNKLTFFRGCVSVSLPPSLSLPLLGFTTKPSPAAFADHYVILMVVMCVRHRERVTVLASSLDGHLLKFRCSTDYDVLWGFLGRDDLPRVKQAKSMAFHKHMPRSRWGPPRVKDCCHCAWFDASRKRSGAK